MNYASIKKCDATNGYGVRVSFFVSGCTHYCKECFNQSAWDFNSGNKFTKEIENEILSSLGKEYIDGISILGGEPLHPKNFPSVILLIRRIKKEFPKKTIWVWTGYTLEELSKMYSLNLLQDIDVLIDGRFDLKQKDVKLKYKGSSNQRVIDVKKTLENKKLVLYED